MPDHAHESLSREQRLDEAVTAFLEAQECGRSPNRNEWLLRYPEVAAELEKYFTDQDEVDRLTVPLRTALHITPPPGDTPQPGSPDDVSSALSPSALVSPPEGYELLQVLGQGGMGLVYKARQKGADRLVALKLIRADRLKSESDVQRFRNETEAAAQLDHPHIVPVYEVGARPGRFFFSMKLIEGGGLDEQLNRFRNDPRGAARLVAQVARAVHHAHQRGILHRDLKPSNILLDREGQPHVSDFGLATRIEADGSLTQTGAIVGTPQYMAPEQTRGQKGAVTTATDVYGLGTVLYALLMGRPPFQGETVLETLEQVRDQDPQPPSKLNPRVDRELESVCLKCLDKDPERRYASADGLAEDLERWLVGEPVAARPAGWTERMWRWMQRHQSAVAAAAALTLILLIVGAVNAWWWMQQKTEAARKQTAAETEARLALEEAERWQKDERWSEALSAIHRAQGVLQGFTADADLQQQIEQRGKDLEMAQRLDEARLLDTAINEYGKFDSKACIDAYVKAFAWYGLDVEHGDVREVAKHIRSRSILMQLVAALDNWMNLQKTWKGRNWKHLLAVARAADPDEWRNRFRNAWERDDSKAINDLLASAAIEELLPSTLRLLGFSNEKQANVSIERALALLRRAQQRHPDDFWINHDLASLLYSKAKPPQLEEAIHCFMICVALRPQSTGAHLDLGKALRVKGRLKEALAEFQEAIRLKKELAPAHIQIGVTLCRMGRLKEAISACREAVRLNKSFALAHDALGLILHQNGQLDEAIAELRECIRLENDLAPSHYNLSVCLRETGRLDEAISQAQEAIRIDKDYAEAYNGLGAALNRKGRLDEAIAAFREAIRIKKTYALAHNNLGNALRDKGRVDNAIDEFRLAIRLKKDLAVARVNLKNALELKEILAKLPAILSGKAKADNPVEQLALAKACQEPYKRLYAAAVRFYSDVFSAQPRLADDLNAQHRYNAACAAALAGCGQGEDVDKIDTKERARLRQQACHWLRADLKAYRQVLEKSAAKAGPLIAERMQHWLQDTDFAGVHGSDALTKLPQVERKEWQKLWQEVEALRQRAAQPLRPDERR